MEKEEVKAMLGQLREVLGEDITQEDLKREMEKVLLHRPIRDTDDVVAANVGLPVEAVTLIRDMIRGLTEEESLQRSRLSYHPHHMRLPTGIVNNHEMCVGKRFVPQYHSSIKKGKEKTNET